MTAQTDTETSGKFTEEIRDWFFTFGHGQHLFTQHYRNAEQGAPVIGKGIHLDGYYVMIHGDYYSARARMVELFGPAWSFQYQQLPDITDLPGPASWRKLIDIPERDDH